MGTELEKAHKDYAVNRCIVTMLVVLAVTGVDAKDCHSALQLALSNASNGGVMAPEAIAIGNDILSVLRNFKKAGKGQDIIHTQHLYKDAFYTTTPRIISQPVRRYQKEERPLPENIKLILSYSIVIRGPNPLS